MVRVCLALLPGLACMVGLFGWGVVLQCLLAVAAALVFESIMLKLRGRDVRTFITDGSILVTALLFALVITPLASWWITVIGIGFAVVFGKHLFGGLGHNLFNPAMAGYAFVFLCFPASMAVWPATTGDTGIDALTYAQCIFATCPEGIDGLTGATPLDHLQSELAAMTMISEIQGTPVYGAIGGSGLTWPSWPAAWPWYSCVSSTGPYLPACYWHCS